MKIVLVLTRFVYAGAEVMVKYLALTLQERGHEIFVISLYSEKNALADELAQKGVQVIFLYKRPGADVHIIWNLYKVLKQIQPDIVQTNLAAIYYVFFANKLAGNARLVHTYHHLAGKGHSLRYLLSKFIFRYGQLALVAVSTEVKKSLVQDYGLQESMVSTIYNGEDFSNVGLKTEYAFTGPVKIVHVGRFADVKNHQLIIESFRELIERHLDATLTLYGEGGLMSAMKGLVARYGLSDRVIFAGVQPDLSKLLCVADIFILPSKREGLGMVLLEAMHAGLPIIASRVGGIPELITDGVSGLLINPTREALTAALVKLMQDEPLRRKLGQQAYQSSLRFSSSEMADKYLQVFKNEQTKI